MFTARKKALDRDTDTGDSENVTGNEGEHREIIGMFLKDRYVLESNHRSHRGTDLPPSKNIAIVTREAPVEVSLELGKGCILLRRCHGLNSGKEH